MRGNKQILLNERGDEQSVYCTPKTFFGGLGAKCIFFAYCTPQSLGIFYEQDCQNNGSAKNDL